MEYKKGDIVFFNWDSFYSKLIQIANYIQYGEKGFSHIGIIGDKTDDGYVIYEAINEGFVKNTYSFSYLDDLEFKDIVEVKRPTKKLRNITENCEKYIGRSYDWLSIIFIVRYILLGKRSLKLFKKDRMLFCSEAVAIILKKCNRNLDIANEYNISESYITPTAIYNSKFVEEIE